MQRITKKIITQIYRPRKEDSHKGDHGHALLVAGSTGRMGAAVISSRACLRTGAGLLSVLLPEGGRGILQAAIPEAMLAFKEDKIEDLNNFSCIGIGPAMGTDYAAAAFLSAMINDCRVPLLLDADALTILSKDKKLLKKLSAQTVITPHPKEFDRLFGEHNSIAEREAAAIKYAAELNIIIVLKGHRTLITNGDKSLHNSTGNAGLAKGGSGDALTGIITALLSQKYKPFDAALLGVYLHGLAADITLQTQSPESMLITDVIENIGTAFNKINK